MGNFIKNSSRRMRITASVTVITIVAIGVILLLNRTGQYIPTTYAKLQHAASKPTCVQTTNNTKLAVNSQDATLIGNEITTSVIDASAGTNVTVNFKTYSGSEATGTASYSSYYGSYNFTVKKVANNSTNSYVGGWRVTRFQACKA